MVLVLMTRNPRLLHHVLTADYNTSNLFQETLKPDSAQALQIFTQEMNHLFSNVHHVTYFFALDN